MLEMAYRTKHSMLIFNMISVSLSQTIKYYLTSIFFLSFYFINDKNVSVTKKYSLFIIRIRDLKYKNTYQQIGTAIANATQASCELPCWEL